MAEEQATANTALTVVEEVQKQVGNSIEGVGDSVKQLGTNLKDKLSAIPTATRELITKLEDFGDKQSKGLERVAASLELMTGQKEAAERREKARQTELEKEKAAQARAGLKFGESDSAKKLKEKDKESSGFLGGLFGGLLGSIGKIFAPLIMFFGAKGPLAVLLRPLYSLALKFGKFGPIGLVILGISLLVKYSEEIGKALEPAVDQLKNLFTTIKPAIDFLFKLGDFLIVGIIDGLGKAIEFLVSIPVNFVNGIKKMFTGDFVGGVEDLFKSIASIIFAVPLLIVNFLGGFGKSIIDRLEEPFQKVRDAVRQSFVDAFDFVKQKFIDFGEYIKELALKIYNPSTNALFGYVLPTLPSLEEIGVWLSDLGKSIYDPSTRELFGYQLPEIPSLEDIKLWVADMAKMIYDPETRQLFGFGLPELPSLEDITLWLADLGKMVWDGDTNSLFGFQLPEIPSLSDIATWISDLGKSIYDPETGAIFGFTLPEMPSIDGMLDKIFDIAKSIYDPETGAIFGFDLMGGVNSVISKIADFGQMMKAISLAGFEAVKAGMPGGESPGEAFARKFAEVMETGNEATTAPIIEVPKAETQMEMVSPDDEMNKSISVINQINNNQQSNNSKTEVMAGNMDITIDPYTDRQLTSFGSVYP